MITRENYEEYIMMYVDGELQPAQEKALNDFLVLHPELKCELQSYELTKLSPDTSITFVGESSLLQSLPVKRSMSFPHWRQYSIAASIAAIIFISLFKFSGEQRDNALVKNEQPIMQERETKEKPPNAAATRQPAIAAAKNDTEKSSPRNYYRSKTLVAKATINNKRENSTTPDLNTAPLPALPEATANKIMLAEIKELPYHKPETPNIHATDIPAYTFAANSSERGKSFWDKLPIDELKKKQLENIGERAANTYQEINAVKKDLDEKTLTIKIEKRKLILSF